MLGGNRFLTVEGRIVEGTRPPESDVAALKKLDPSIDVDTVGAPGDPVTLTDGNRAQWEAAARIGGHRLAQLLDN